MLCVGIYVSVCFGEALRISLLAGGVLPDSQDAEAFVWLLLRLRLQWVIMLSRLSLANGQPRLIMAEHFAPGGNIYYAAMLHQSRL